MKKYKKLFEANLDFPKVGDIVLTGKFKNRPAEVVGFDTDENNQPLIITSPGGKRKLFPFRIKRLMSK